MTKIAYIPDTQVKDGINTDHLSHIGCYLADKEPDIIIFGGDFADMPSLSSYDVFKKSFEGRRYTKDIEAAQMGMAKLLTPIEMKQNYQRRNKKKVYDPRKIITLGNHENRIDRAINNDAKLEGLISTRDLGYESFGIEVVPFLKVIVIEGVAFSHYFPSGVAGRACTTANAQLNKKHMSCVAGHQQGLQIATAHRADGQRITSIIAGSCYTHEEDYLGEQGNVHWRGMLMLHSVQDGEFDLVSVPLHYLKKKYS